MRKTISIFLLAASFAGCKTVETQRTSTSPVEPKPAEVVSTPKVSLENLTKEQRKRLDESLPAKVRKILDNAEELEISNIPTTVAAKISEQTMKKRFLESFYYDVSLSEVSSKCWKPRHKILAKHKNEAVGFEICYECWKFEGISPSGSFFGNLGGNESESVANELINKYGTPIQK